MRASTNSLVVAITMGSDSLFDDSLELVDARHGNQTSWCQWATWSLTFCGSWSSKVSSW